MNRLKNSLFSKVLHVLLIGYFIISSLNLSQSINRIATQDTDVHKKESAVWGIFKKMLKCNTSAEEFEDCDNEQAKDNNKIKLVVDYIIPGQTGILLCDAFAVSAKKIYLTQTGLNGILYNKIHLPPPEVTL